MTEKIEWRKTEPWYGMKKRPQIVEMPAQHYFTITGVGDPNQPEFQRRIGVLYALSYAIRMSQKSDWLIPDFKLYTVYPLEGDWTIQPEFYQAPRLEKDHFAYTLKIKQPDFVTPVIAEEAMERAAKKIPADLKELIQFVEQPAKIVGQILHIGSYDDEPATFERLAEFLQAEGYQRSSKDHTEVYMSDPRRVAPEKLKTILRVDVAKI